MLITKILNKIKLFKSSFYTKNNTLYKNIKNIDVGEHTYGEPTLLFFENNKIQIGKYCSIADGVIIMGGENIELIG